MHARLAPAVLIAAVAVGGSLVTAGPAQAVGCAAFKTAVQNANNGEVITLNAGLTCNDAYVLPTNKTPLAFTIQGAGAGATLDGTGLGSRIMTGEPAAGKQLHVTIRNLTFRHSSSSSSGGALFLSGNDLSATLDRDRFLGNSAIAGADSGAVFIGSFGSSRTITVTDSTFGDGTASGANTSSYAGAMEITSQTNGPSVTLLRNKFARNTATNSAGALVLNVNAPGTTATIADNVFTGNTAHGSNGGGATIGTNSLTLRRNRFVGNRLATTTGTGGFGGGIAFYGDAGMSAQLTQSDNRFDRNRITRGSQTDFDAGGGGEWVGGYSLTSRGDRFTNNSIPTPAGTGAAEGGGLGIEGCPSPAPQVTARLENAVAAGNTAGAGGVGAGLYAGGCSGGPLQTTVLDSTVAGNRTSGGGATAGLAGGPTDTLTMRNSIVAGNVGAIDLSGFGAGRTVTFSDACAPAVLPGAGNICKKPLLLDPGHGNVHETPISPTINKGSNAQVPAGLTKDYEGNKRILGGRVDMGADEYKDPFAGVKIRKQTVTVKNGVANVRVGCPRNIRGPCAGDLKLVRNGQSLGHKGFTIKAGGSARVAVQLSSAGLVALQSSGPLKCVARATATDGFGTKRKSSGKVKLKA